MTRTILLQELRKMRFQGAFEGWDTGRLTQVEVAQMLGNVQALFSREF